MFLLFENQIIQSKRMFVFLTRPIFDNSWWNFLLAMVICKANYWFIFCWLLNIQRKVFMQIQD